MSSGLPQGPQKQMFIISSIGFVITDIIQLISTILYFIWGSRYDAFVMAIILLVFLCLQLLISIIFIVMASTCWQGQFFEKIFKTYLNRFFYFSDLIITHIPIIAVSIMFITLPDYEPKLRIMKYIIFSISIIELIFFLLLIIGLIISCKIQSDKETIENSEAEDSYQKFFVNPQKLIMQISLITLFTFTVIDFIISIVLYLGSSSRAFSFELINALFGGFVIIITIIMLITSQTCWKGTFVNKLVQNNIRRLVLFLVAFLYYIGYITFEILYFIFHVGDLNKSKIFTFEISMALICPLVQFISIVVFTVGFCIAHQNKVRYDLRSSSLINNNDHLDN